MLAFASAYLFNSFAPLKFEQELPSADYAAEKAKYIAEAIAIFFIFPPIVS